MVERTISRPRQARAVPERRIKKLHPEHHKAQRDTVADMLKNSPKNNASSAPATPPAQPTSTPVSTPVATTGPAANNDQASTVSQALPTKGG